MARLAETSPTDSATQEMNAFQGAALVVGPFLGRSIIARNQNTYAKRQREAAKKRKAEEKRQRRALRKQNLGHDAAGESLHQQDVSCDNESTP